MFMDFKKYYYLEQYLFDEVGPLFRKTGELSAENLLCILIWKANRSKTKTLQKLTKRYKNDIRQAALRFAVDIYDQPTPKDRLKILIKTWGLRLPTASAILTVLYPEEFTVYDVRVCGILGRFHGLADKVNFDSVWAGYQEFIKCVREEVPKEKSLRNKDRYLWGKSFFESLGKSLEKH